MGGREEREMREMWRKWSGENRGAGQGVSILTSHSSQLLQAGRGNNEDSHRVIWGIKQGFVILSHNRYTF